MWHPHEDISASETDPSNTGATALGGSISHAEPKKEEDIDPLTVNPFKSEALEWTELLGKDWPKAETYRPEENFANEEVRETSSGSAILTSLADIEAKQISWLWPGRIALGKITLIAGDPGLGKSLLTATIAAIVSKGYIWPLETTASPIGSVILLSAEDDPADTIKPRLEAAEADCNRIHVLQAVRGVDSEGNPTERMFSLKRDIAVLEKVLPSLPDCHLLVIDPISAYLEGTDSHNNSDVRALLAPLAKLASDHHIAIVLVQHLNKNSGGSAMYRAMGSVAFIAAARAGYIVTKDQNNPERRLVMPTKNNLAKDNTGLAYSVREAENGYPVIAWETEPVTITADEALAPLQGDEEKTDTDWAVDFLEGELANGPVPVGEVNKNAKQAGISIKSLRRAREKLGVVTKKSEFKGGWVCSLTRDEDAQRDEGAQPEIEGILATEGHLRSAETSQSEEPSSTYE